MGETKQQILYNPLLGIFFISGFLGLGYQVLWSKFLLNFIGVSAYSYAIVLATFMGGLALGSHYLGKLTDRGEVLVKALCVSGAWNRRLCAFPQKIHILDKIALACRSEV
jgi:hypothetical protein